MAVTDDEYGDGEYGDGEPDQHLHVASAIEALPGLARIAASTGLHTLQWSASMSWRVTRRLAAAARDPELAAELAHELGTTVSAVHRLGRAVGDGVPLSSAVASLGPAPELTPEQQRASQRHPARDSGRDVGDRAARLGHVLGNATDQVARG